MLLFQECCRLTVTGIQVDPCRAVMDGAALPRQDRWRGRSCHVSGQRFRSSPRQLATAPPCMSPVTSQPLVTSCPCHVCLLHHCTAPSWHVVSERSSTCCLLVRCLHCHSARWVTDEVMMIIYVLLYSLSSVLYEICTVYITPVVTVYYLF